jgi:hypothetical protein
VSSLLEPGQQGTGSFEHPAVGIGLGEQLGQGTVVGELP